ncbi:efflux RND transporter periplasmic adaptor subunit [Natronincola ferrireducens]|uniref:RND family efflux transporter, MFP subunit n=1 Tax=Natronincola ferrireducens TaxID=393762 RepID=A0A1G9FFF6_9FIRM|nr:efflux RND transporter periplasmic adaptor subunit [Natronincola ferrireducens]SDK87076.1 RND family efflux transporter, MFP subunit [Natronincola ferrireducens]
MSKRISLLIFFLILLNLLLMGCSGDAALKAQADQENVFAVEVMKPQLGDISQSITLSGQLQAVDAVTVIPEIQGLLEVKTLNVKLGDYVTRGDVLFVLDRESIEDHVASSQLAYETSLANYHLQKEILEEQIANARLGYEAAKKNYDNAKTNFDRIEQLYKAGAVSQQDYEQAKLMASDIPYQQAKLNYENRKASQAQLSLYEAQLEQAKTAYTNSLKNLDNTIVTAPINGIVSSLQIQEKGLVSPQPALTITDISTLEAVIQVTEGMINRVIEADNVNLVIPSISDEIRKGFFTTINPVADPMTQLYTIKIQVDNPQGIIKPGMFSHIYINTNEKADVVTLPSDAVLQEGGNFYVFVVSDERAVRKDVVVGLDSGELIEVVEGITTEDVVIIKGQDFIKDGYKVNIVRGEF